ncbi:hypothetical protein GIB67_013744 [Kingdonia uniflora]|uniref:Late embryogenesis abundant protein LEA-2 subgroup domain-containing protein n=1 Tax=Kingdonia uniflora TaxID=39325 RepID=A0A7J7NQS6_9MAGN|nr:hypothetical protein GIB67_013744 [Kingdonia uniflora]
MSGKEKSCGKHGNHYWYGRIFTGIITFICIVLCVVLIVGLILHPHKPYFTLQDATVYQLNVSSPNFLSSSIQVTIGSRNPNGKIGIYYDRLDVFASYRNQQITLLTSIPPSYQGHRDINVWSPYITGNTVPVAPYLAVSLIDDQSAGMILLNIKIDGRLRWKVGTWISGGYHIDVNCPAYLTFGDKYSSNTIGIGPAMKYQLDRQCNTNV